MELLRYHGKGDLYNQLKEWQIPAFPIKGNLLVEKGAPKGQQLGQVLSELKMIWAANQFNMSESELLEHLPDVLAQLKIKKKE